MQKTFEIAKPFENARNFENAKNCKMHKTLIIIFLSVLLIFTRTVLAFNPSYPLIKWFDYWLPTHCVVWPRSLCILRHVQHWSTIELSSSMFYTDTLFSSPFYVLSFSVDAPWRSSLDTNKYMYMRFRFNNTQPESKEGQIIYNNR